jgi:trehalose 6-phosphate synthase
VVWIHRRKFTGAELAALYRYACVLLVNPIRDGLNLTTKEYVASQYLPHSGVLALSEGAGAWQELGEWAVTVDPSDPKQMADAINHCLTMPADEKRWRMGKMQDSVLGNPIDRWFGAFQDLSVPVGTPRLVVLPGAEDEADRRLGGAA